MRQAGVSAGLWNQEENSPCPSQPLPTANHGSHCLSTLAGWCAMGFIPAAPLNPHPWQH